MHQGIWNSTQKGIWRNDKDNDPESAPQSLRSDGSHLAAGTGAEAHDDRSDGSHLAAGSGADTSPDAVEIIDADTHPPFPTRFADAEEILNCISQEALTDASHDAPTQQPQPATQHAAQDILCTLFTSKGGTAIRSLEEVLQCMSEPIRRRKEVVSSITQGTAAYTVEEWMQWFRHHPLGEREMDAAVERWRSEFEANDMHQHSIDKVQEWRKQDTRNSKKSARDFLRGAWRQHVETTCGSFQLTMLFLTYPAATVKTLLQAHATYMSSPQHEEEVQRASELDKTNEAAVAEKERQVQLKVQLGRDRSDRRRALALHKKITAGEVDAPFPSVAPFYYSWKSGLLDKRIDEASAKHGYGRTTSGHMHAPRVKDFVEQLGGSLTQNIVEWQIRASALQIDPEIKPGQRPLETPWTIDVCADEHRYKGQYCGHGASKVVYVLTMSDPACGPFHGKVLKLVKKDDMEPHLFAKHASVGCYPQIYAERIVGEFDDEDTRVRQWNGWISDKAEPLDQVLDRLIPFQAKVKYLVGAARCLLHAFVSHKHCLDDISFYNFGVLGGNVVIIDAGGRHEDSELSKGEFNKKFMVGKRFWVRADDVLGDRSDELTKYKEAWRNETTMSDAFAKFDTFWEELRGAPAG